MSESAMPAPGASRATAWAQVVTLSLTEITSWGILYYSFPVFLGPMEHALRWSQAALTGAFSLALLISGLMAIPIGRWLDHARSPRALMTLGSLLGATALVVWSAVTSLPLFYAVWIALGVAMAATLYEPAFTTLAAWFPRRERALTVLTTVGGLASVIYLPVTALLVEHLGWRAALLALATIILVGAALPHLLILRPYAAAMRHASRAANESASPVASWRTWSFWQLVAGFALSQVAISALIVYLIPYLSQRGMNATLAASASGLIGVTALVGRMLATWRSTPQTRAAMTALCFLALAAGVLLLTLAPGPIGLALFIILFGVGFGVYSPARAGLVADRFGAAIFGRVNGQVALAITLARAAGPALAGALLFRGVDFAHVFWALAALAALSAITLWLPLSCGRGGWGVRSRATTTTLH